MNEHQITHGQAMNGCAANGYTPEYNIWNAMKARCGNPNAKSYPDVGGRGIKVCERWLTAANFLKDMGPRPDHDHILTRMDPDGDFMPENCSWKPYGVAQHNTKLTSNNTSGVKGVHKARAGYQAKITFDGNAIHLGTFETLDEAAKARRKAEDRYW